MQLRQLRIEHFRGIESLEWSVPSGSICLVGPGDSGKTTLLDAIHLSLAAPWSATFNDHDFYAGDVTRPITIETTVTDIPEALLDETKFGLYLRGWGPDGTLRDEPDDDCLPALTVRLGVDDSLEPTWSVVTDRDADGKGLSWRDRQRLGVARVGTWVDRDFRWTRGSALARLSGETDEIDRTLAEAQRQARRAVAGADLGQVDKPVEHARTQAKELGVGDVADAFHAGLDVTTNDLRLALHSNDLPISTFGQGTRRLTALGLQLVNEGKASMLLIDEIEHALEPFRLRHLVRTLRARVTSADAGAKQALCTTHSNIAVEQFNAAELHVVRRDSGSGTVTITAVPDSLQGHVRKHAEAFLARRLVVCEGSTEAGTVVALDDPIEGVTAAALANHGAVVVPGGGSSAPLVAKRFRKLGFETALIVDSDRPLSPTPDDLRAIGVHVLQWKGNVAIEDRLALDLPAATLAQLVDNLATEVGDHVLKELAEQLDLDLAVAGMSVVDWREGGLVSDDRLRESVRASARTAVGEARWFKSIRAGEAAGRAVRSCWSEIEGTELHEGFGQLLAWVTR